MQTTPNTAQTTAVTVPRESGGGTPTRGPETMPKTQVLPNVQSGADTASQAREPSQAELQRAMTEVQRKVQSMSPNIEFSLDDTSGRTIVSIVDASTRELIRQIPSKEMLEISQDIERLQGLLLNKQA